MSWAKFDDLYDDNKKVKRAWRASRGAVGLHAMAITYCARHELDGVVDIDWLIDKLPKDAERRKILAVLVEHDLFRQVDDEHYEVNDYLVYNQSRAEAEARREKDRARKADHGGRGGRTDSKRIPSGIRAESKAPDPTRPDPEAPTTPLTPQGGNLPIPVRPSGNRLRERQEYDDQVQAFAVDLLPDVDLADAIDVTKGALGLPGADSATRAQLESRARTLLPARYRTEAAA